MPSICKSQLLWASYSLSKITVSFLWNAFFALSFIMHYTEYYTMHHYTEFSQIGSHLCTYVPLCTYVCMHVCTYVRMYVYNVRIYVRMYVCVCVCVCVCMYVGMYVCTKLSSLAHKKVLVITMHRKILVWEKIGELGKLWTIHQSFPCQYSQMHRNCIWHMHWLAY